VVGEGIAERTLGGAAESRRRFDRPLVRRYAYVDLSVSGRCKRELDDQRMEPRAGILVVRKQSGYKDIPWVRYHFPKARYIAAAERLKECLILLYEPRRVGPAEASGGRMGFVGFAFVDRIWDDPEDGTHAFIGYRYPCEFVRVVPLDATTVSSKSMQFAIQAIRYAEAEEVVKRGLFVEQPPAGIRQGLTDTNVLETVGQRDIREVLSSRAIRDATFRYRVVEEAYKGHCALTGIRMTNGFGRAEVDAAHIQPVEAGGPDSTRNGLALMKSLHWAFDRGLVSLADDGKILTAERGLDSLVLRMLPKDRRAFLPHDRDQQPHHAFLHWHRSNRFKGTFSST
jgi:putative restriction endonuclease